MLDNTLEAAQKGNLEELKRLIEDGCPGILSLQL
jgi:hypothetical protein